MYKIVNHKVDDYDLERMYHVLEELRHYNVYDMERYIVLTACMEELTKRSKRLKALVETAERIKYEHN